VTFPQHSPPPRRVSPGGRSWARWIVVAAGLAVLVVSLIAAVGPYRQTTEFREMMACERSGGGCFGAEGGTIADRRTYTTTETTTHTDADGRTRTSTRTITHHEITWQRADGTRQARDVDARFYAKAEEGRPATLRLWRGEVVGVEVAGGAAWFPPEVKGSLAYWLYLAFIGLGVLLWGLLPVRWDGVLMLAYRAFCWTAMGFLPVHMAADALAGNLGTGLALTAEIVGCLLIAAITGTMLVRSLTRRRP
jgi:hypothetical protein